MVLDILLWTYRKYKVYCFIALILLTTCILGYTALIIYWIRNLMKATKERKKQPPPNSPEKLTASPARLRPTEAPTDQIMQLEDRPTLKARNPKLRHRPRRSRGAVNSLTPSPLQNRATRRKRRRRVSEHEVDFENEGSADRKTLENWKRRLKLPPLSFPTRSPRIRRVSDRLKDNRPTYKQYLFVWYEVTKEQDEQISRNWSGKGYVFWRIHWVLFQRLSFPRLQGFSNKAKLRGIFQLLQETGKIFMKVPVGQIFGMLDTMICSWQLIQHFIPIFQNSGLNLNIFSLPWYILLKLLDLIWLLVHLPDISGKYIVADPSKNRIWLYWI